MQTNNLLAPLMQFRKALIACIVVPHLKTMHCFEGNFKTSACRVYKKFDVPTLILHGDDDQIVPIQASALLSSKLIKGAKLKIYPGAPHGMCTTLKNEVNADLLAFIQG